MKDVSIFEYSNELLSFFKETKKVEKEGLTIRQLRKKIEKEEMPFAFQKGIVQEFVAINLGLGYLYGPALGHHSNPMLPEEKKYIITERGRERLALANQRK